ncbi:Integrator complex subunit 9 protein [Dioscorea alata]|uniref:Integrator complex subunit 9 protein n=2 Tax=Dioscorea alata TaxID=55571 RepID=A0ACB7VR39_DIOAL|nr:Integrator complex subunit 9 protein [Dioscorea alata]KAH7677097.1 Integrator complex subunit 9 protein [Dioscorea alata]
MKLTCLSMGRGLYCPPCHMLELCGFRVLLECPLDLSALTVFSPVIPNSATDLIRAVPWYKSVKSLHLWDPSLIDLVLISTPYAMLGLPFLTCLHDFSGKIYATEAVVRIGCLMMEELVSMHVEYNQFYGLDERPGCPGWMEWEELKKLPLELRDIVMGKDGEELGSWMPLYSATDVKECMLKIHSLRYGEEACYNSTLILKSFSSGLEIGSSNWMINGPRRNFTYLSSSILKSAHAMGFDYYSLQGNDLILFSDLSVEVMHDGSNDANGCKIYNETVVEDPLPYHISAVGANCASEQDLVKCLLENDEILEESDKIAFICSCVLDSLNEGGSVLIPIGRIGIVHFLLEKIWQYLELSNMMVPIFMISTISEEILASMNAMPEWLCEERQLKLFSGEPLFGHIELIKEKKLYLFPVLNSSNLSIIWQEPCLVFCPHWNLRLGPAVHLLRRWHKDHKSLLILEEGVDAEMALLPFKTLSMKVLQCSFLAGMKLKKIQPLLELLQPKLVLFPDRLKSQLNFSKNYTHLYYSENSTLRVPSLKDDFEVRLMRYLDFKLQPRILPQENLAIARLEGQLLLSNGNHLLVPVKKPTHFSSKQQLHWGSVDIDLLLKALKDKGIDGLISYDETAPSHGVRSIHISAPDEAVIEIDSKQTVISAANENLTAVICETFSSVCSGM